MTLKAIFNKPVDRHIEGVIKADDEASLRLEVEEYVLTNEVEKRLESFLDAYNNYRGANGVWISGFFGSGKSHLLKMMALLLENRKIDGEAVLDPFLNKCGDNEILRGDLKRAVAIPSKSILFNIDQKADVISKTQVDALLAVFVKVFDEMCGYYGKQPYIAQFERDLDNDGLLEKFKHEFSKLSGKDWEWGRSRPARVSSFVDQAFNQVSGQQQENVLDKCRSDYRLSIEDFAEQIHAYLERQSPDFRLNFFVDEVGQYIADNVKLMTNLQTIAESLATKCKGRSWIIVTSQNDMSTLLGEMNPQQSNDFSKIMARFETKMLLTSTNVAEVIQKRLLEKTEDGVEAVSDVYHREVNNFGTLFHFSDGSREYSVYKDRDEFIRCYPFIPYQFELFQSSIENLSRHNAFEGKHSSVGERSMLAVFQQVAIQISDYEMGQLAGFDLMFGGIQTALKAQTQKAILDAERQLKNDFPVRVLKALFLIKYVKEFKATTRNLCVLMLDRFNDDLTQLRKKIEEALSFLEQQTYIQRNGDIYEYLTDEEKDVEQEIKNTEVESADVAAELETLIFDNVIKNRKIRYDDNGQDYSFSRKLDDRLHGREYELAIHVISPFHEHAENETMLRTNSTYNMNELMVLMPPDDRLMRDLLMYRRTEKYIRQNITTTQQELIRRILTDKGFQNRERHAELRKRVKDLLGKAKLLVAGKDVEIAPSEDAQSRIFRGFQELVSRLYPNLGMLRGVNYTENDILKYLKQSEEGLFGDDVKLLPESEQEILSFIQSNKRGGVRTTLKSLLEKFERAPYGWGYAAMLCTLAKLCGRGKIEVRVDSNLLEEDEIEQAFRNTHGHGNVVLEPQVEFTASQIRVLKEFYEDFFETPPRASEAKTLGKETGIAFHEILSQLTPLASQATQYPFLKALIPAIEKIKEAIDKPYAWYLTDLAREKDNLLDMKEDILDPIRKFMNGPQKDIFDNAVNFIRSQETNFAYIENNEVSQISNTLEDPHCFKGNRMQQVKTHVENLQEKVTYKIDEAISQAKEGVAELKDRLCGSSEFNALQKEEQEPFIQQFDELIHCVDRQNLIAVVYDTLRRFKEIKYPELVENVCKAPQNGKSYSVLPVTSVIKNISFEKALLADETDVSSYLESIREKLLEVIKQGKRIQI